MVEIAVIGDTHIPSRTQSIPEWVEKRVRRADRTVHVGDFDSSDAYDRVREIAGEGFVAVTGNMDPALDLPSVATIELEGLTFVVTHGTGPASGYEDRVADVVRQEGGDVGLAGHTHEPLDTTHRGVRLLNPGSATGAAPATATSMMTLTVEDGTVEVDLEER